MHNMSASLVYCKKSATDGFQQIVSVIDVSIAESNLNEGGFLLKPS